MNDLEFINREVEQATILTAINTLMPKNKVLIIKGTSGVGKSALTSFILKQQKRYPGVKVRIEDSYGSPTSGYGIERIAEAINQAAENNGNLKSFKVYFNNLEGNDLKQRAYDLLAKSTTKILGPFGDAAKFGHDALFGSGEFDSVKLFNSTRPEIINILTSYIFYTLNNGPIVLNIENIHALDITTLQLLHNLIEGTSGNTFLLEFTTDSDRKMPLHRVREYFENVFLDEIELHKVSMSDYMKILGVKGMNTVLEKSYFIFDGNLRKLKDLEITLDISSNEHLDIFTVAGLHEFNPTTANIKSLKKRELLLLCAIAAHKSAVAIDVLHALFKQSSLRNEIVDIPQSLKVLTAQQLIITSGNKVLIAHDLINRSIRFDDYFFKYLLLSYKSYVELYSNYLSIQDFVRHSKEEVLSLLFHFYYFYDAEKLFGLLPDIKRIALKSFYPEAAIQYIEELRKSIRTTGANKSLKIADDITYQLVDIYYASGLFENAFNLLSEIELESDKKTLYKIALLDRLDRHVESLELINTQLTRNDLNSRVRLVLELILMIDLRSLLLWDELERLYEKLSSNDNYIDYLEYGYFLRNSEIVLPFEESIPLLEQSIEHFYSYDNLMEVGISKISLSMQLARLGQLDKALSELNEAETLLSENTLVLHIILNNKAVIKMYQGITDAGVEEILNSARLTAITNFDKIIVYSNLLILNTLNTNKQSVEDIVEILLQLVEEQPDKNIVRFCYYNISFSYTMSKENVLANQFLNKARGILEIVENYWDHRINNATLTDKAYSFVCSFPFELGFISYWHFDISQCASNQ